MEGVRRVVPNATGDEKGVPTAAPQATAPIIPSRIRHVISDR